MVDTPESLLARTAGFQWDQHNEPKILERHDVTSAEVEQAFFHNPLLIATDLKHSGAEVRLIALGRTNGERRLQIVFTIRQDRIRPISARDMTRKERDQYAKATPQDRPHVQERG